MSLGLRVWLRVCQELASKQKKPLVAIAYWSPVVIKPRKVVCGLKGFSGCDMSKLQPGRKVGHEPLPYHSIISGVHGRHV